MHWEFIKEILKSEDDKINRLFRFNLNNQYTTIDLRNAEFWN